MRALCVVTIAALVLAIVIGKGGDGLDEYRAIHEKTLAGVMQAQHDREQREIRESLAHEAENGR